MTIELAVNYSIPAAGLLRQSKIVVDRFKCPAWPYLLAEVLAEQVPRLRALVRAANTALPADSGQPIVASRRLMTDD